MGCCCVLFPSSVALGTVTTMASLYLNSLSSSSSVPALPQSRRGAVAEAMNKHHPSFKGLVKPIVITGNPPTFVSSAGRRIVAVGDLHGDLAQTRCALEMAGVLNSDGRDLWTGGDTILIQLGDILDRGEDEIAILSLLHSLSIQAKIKGGAVFQVNGNHESMNVEGDFRYVDSGAFDECVDFLDYLDDYGGNWEEAFVDWIRMSERWKEDRKMSSSYWSQWNVMKRQKGVIARSSLFRPGGPLACELARHGVVLKVDDWVFCHGGLLPHHVYYGIERMNREVSGWMRGFNENHNLPELPFIATRGYDSVVWNRLYSRDTFETEYRSHQIHAIVKETLNSVGAKAMVVGHTPQPEGVNCKYNCTIWRIDVGMSHGVLNSTPQVLEIIGDKARVIRNRPNSFGGLQMEYT